MFMNPIAIIGAGITGLSAAFKLRQRGVPVVVYEASGRVGGVIQTDRRHGWLAECGPNSILETSPKISDLIRDLDLTSRRIYSAPQAEKRFLVRNGRLVQLPGSPQGMVATRLFSWHAKLRLLGEPFIRRAPADAEESLAQFVPRRLGREFLGLCHQPVCRGRLCWRDPAKLSVKHAFPKLHALEQRYGSLILGQIFGARERRRRAEISKQTAKKFSFDDGLRVLTDTLHSRLGDAVQLHTPVKRVDQTSSGWQLVDNHGCELPTEHSAVLLATPAHQLAKLEITCSSRREGAVALKSKIQNPKSKIEQNLLTSAAPGAGASSRPLSTLGDMHYPPVTSLVLGFQREDVAHPLDGFGMLIPEVEGFNVLGTIFSSSLFPNRAPEGHVLLTSYLGGARAPELALANEDEQVALALSDLRKLLGVRSEPTFVHRFTFPRAIPQYDVGFGRFKQLMDDFEADNPGMFLAGHFRDGISLGDSIVAGCNVAERVAQFVSRSARGDGVPSISHHVAASRESAPVWAQNRRRSHETPLQVGSVKFPS